MNQDPDRDHGTSTSHSAGSLPYASRERTSTCPSARPERAASVGPQTARANGQPQTRVQQREPEGPIPTPSLLDGESAPLLRGTARHRPYACLLNGLRGVWLRGRLCPGSTQWRRIEMLRSSPTTKRESSGESATASRGLVSSGVVVSLANRTDEPRRGAAARLKAWLISGAGSAQAYPAHL